MISGLHVVMYSEDAEADRAFFRDVLDFPNVDVGEGWLLFRTPPAELAMHPVTHGGQHEVFLMCDDVNSQMKTLAEAGYPCSQIIDEGWGLFTTFTLPGGGKIGLYEPRHKLPPRRNSK